MGPDPSWTDDNDFGGSLDPISQEAVTWFATVHADEVTKANQVAFRAWLRRDERHRADRDQDQAVKDRAVAMMIRVALHAGAHDAVGNDWRGF